jgi:hypothetical protein
MPLKFWYRFKSDPCRKWHTERKCKYGRRCWYYHHQDEQIRLDWYDIGCCTTHHHISSSILDDHYFHQIASYSNNTYNCCSSEQFGVWFCSFGCSSKETCHHNCLFYQTLMNLTNQPLPSLITTLHPSLLNKNKKITSYHLLHSTLSSKNSSPLPQPNSPQTLPTILHTSSPSSALSTPLLSSPSSSLFISPSSSIFSSSFSLIFPSSLSSSLNSSPITLQYNHDNNINDNYNNNNNMIRNNNDNSNNSNGDNNNSNNVSSDNIGNRIITVGNQSLDSDCKDISFILDESFPLFNYVRLPIFISFCKK